MLHFAQKVVTKEDCCSKKIRKKEKKKRKTDRGKARSTKTFFVKAGLVIHGDGGQHIC